MAKTKTQPPPDEFALGDLSDLDGACDLTGLDGGMLDADADVLGSRAPDPLAGIDYQTATVGQAAEQEVSAVLAAFKGRQERENERLVKAIDSEYWCCLCFRTRAEKDAFLKQFNLARLGDKYLDGNQVERELLKRRD